MSTQYPEGGEFGSEDDVIVSDEIRLPADYAAATIPALRGVARVLRQINFERYDGRASKFEDLADTFTEALRASGNEDIIPPEDEPVEGHKTLYPSPAANAISDYLGARGWRG